MLAEFYYKPLSSGVFKEAVLSTFGGQLFW